MIQGANELEADLIEMLMDQFVADPVDDRKIALAIIRACHAASCFQDAAEGNTMLRNFLLLAMGILYRARDVDERLQDISSIAPRKRKRLLDGLDDLFN
jgi:hypothetical protein